MNRWEVVTRNIDDEIWDLTEQVIEREFMDDGRIRWVIDTEATGEMIMRVVPSAESIEPRERPEPESGGPDLSD